MGVAILAGVPDAVTRILKGCFDRAINDAAFRASLDKLGYSALRPQSEAAIAEFIDTDRARWSVVIKAQNIAFDWRHGP